MPTQTDIHHAGNALVAAAASVPQSTADIVREMFPYIWQASRTLSTRKISDWLKTEQNISLSQATVSRALRNAPMYWAELADKIEPAARIISEFTSSRPLRILFDEDYFEEIFHDSLRGPERYPGDDDYETIDDTRAAIDFLRSYWFIHSAEVRANCRRYVDTDDEHENEHRERLEALDGYHAQQ